MLAVGGLPVFNVVVVKFYINCMVAINRCMIVLVLILIYTSLTVNYSYLRIIRLTMRFLSNRVHQRFSPSLFLIIQNNTDLPSSLTRTITIISVGTRRQTTRDR